MKYEKQKCGFTAHKNITFEVCAYLISKRNWNAIRTIRMLVSSWKKVFYEIELICWNRETEAKEREGRGIEGEGEGDRDGEREREK